MKRETYYDYIRAFAALLVLFAHKGKLPGGAIGVSIFFCLSGFLITRILMGLPELSFPNLAKFIFRRWMRIFPLYVAAILATYLLMRQFRPDLLGVFLSFVPGLLTFTSFTPDVGFSVAIFWTLQAEFWFYATFPFVFALCYPRGLLMPAAFALIGVSFWAKFSIPLVLAFSFTPLLTLIYLDQLMFGVICALLIGNKSSVIHLFRSRWWFWGALATTLVTSKLSHLTFWYYETSAAALLCAIAILHHAADPKELKDNFVAWLGRISFSIYLVHGVVRDYLPAKDIPDKLDTPSFILVVLVISHFTERFIERPGIRFSKAIARYTRSAKSTFDQVRS